MITVGSTVKCLWTMRRSKTYSRFGIPAKQGDVGVVRSMHDLKDVTIVIVAQEDGAVRHAHYQNWSEQK